MGADFVSVAYSPGRSVRVDSTAMAQVIGLSGEQDVIFSLAPRDMNKLALQNHLLGAQALGLENVVVLGGDEFTPRDRGLLTRVNDYRSTGLIKAIGDLNRGEDFRGLKLRKPTEFCIGAVIDFGASDIEREARLTEKEGTSRGDISSSARPFTVLKWRTAFTRPIAMLPAAICPYPYFMVCRYWNATVFSSATCQRS